MFKPLPLWIGIRYTRSKHKNHFVSFISLSSMLGIALGVMVLITVLSVMNGFDEEIHKRFFGMAPEITVVGTNNHISSWPEVQQTLNQFPDVIAVSPFVSGQGLLTSQGHISPVIFNGIIPKTEEALSHIKHKLIIGNLNIESFGIVVGLGLAEALNIKLGDKVTMMIPEATVTPAGLIPRFKRFTVQGIFSAGTGFNFDNRLAYIALDDAQKLMQMQNSVSGFKLRIKKIYDAPRLSQLIAQKLGEQYQVGNWTTEFGPFFQAIKMEKSMMFFILILIIAVAAFNLVSSLVMVVSDKRPEIAILRTMGATPQMILKIFMIQGMTIGIVGTILGLIFGVLLSYNATDIVTWLQHFLNIQLISANIYFVDFLPSKIMVTDLLKVSAIALIMSFVATIYPARRAAKTIIVEALHAEP